jgi:site-specific DNA recombinase
VARTAKPVRCAIYTRKSTEEGLDKEFSSLDAQRESAQAYIKSQASHGWTMLRTRYDDGGFTGGNMDRPALKRLLTDIQAGQVDCVVVYKVDRLSRSLLDFARMMETFEKHQVSFVSVTQQFNTATSMGRLVLNVLLSFAQFEREIISERTRDKIAAARRKGKWAGGMPLLGYDVDPKGSKLVINPTEAAQVREIFALYLANQGLVATVQALEKRGWKTKRWQTRLGHERGGRSFNKASLHKLLTNVVYRGQVRYKDEVHLGEHEAIVDDVIWQEVQDLLHRQCRSGERTDSAALLKGLLFCGPCQRAMTPTFSSKRGGKRYGYYICVNAVQRGRKACPSHPVPQPAIETWLVERLRDHLASVRKSPEIKAEGGQAFLPEPSAEQVRQWIAQIQYDGSQDKASITFRTPTETKEGK